MEPLFTLVTVCFNSVNSIEKTIQSVLNQKFTDYEYLIIDGKSTDGTVELAKAYLPRFSGKMRIISEEDEGWYDAMNKGIRFSTGKFIAFINSDDYFAENALQVVADYIKKYKVNDDSILYGDSTNIYVNSAGELLYRYVKAPDNIDVSNPALKNGMCGIRHQSMFTGRAVFKNVGELDLQYRLHADWDFMIKTLNEGISYRYVGQNLSFYSMYGVSTKATYDERHRVRKNNRLYKIVDCSYFRDRFGLKALLKRTLGDKKWNALIYKIHRMKQDKGEK